MDNDQQFGKSGKPGVFWWLNGEVWTFNMNHMPAAKNIWPEQMEWWDETKSFENYEVPFSFGAIRGGISPYTFWINGPPELKGDLNKIKRVVRDVYNATGKGEVPEDVNVDCWPNGSTRYAFSDLVKDMPELPDHLKNQVEEFWEPGPADVWLDNIRQRMMARLKRRRIIRAILIGLMK